MCRRSFEEDAVNTIHFTKSWATPRLGGGDACTVCLSDGDYWLVFFRGCAVRGEFRRQRTDSATRFIRLLIPVSSSGFLLQPRIEGCRCKEEENRQTLGRRRCEHTHEWISIRFFPFFCFPWQSVHALHRLVYTFYGYVQFYSFLFFRLLCIASDSEEFYRVKRYLFAANWILYILHFVRRSRSNWRKQNSVNVSANEKER